MMAVLSGNVIRIKLIQVNVGLNDRHQTNNNNNDSYFTMKLSE